jgi:hypothetical protein
MPEEKEPDLNSEFNGNDSRSESFSYQPETFSPWVVDISPEQSGALHLSRNGGGFPALPEHHLASLEIATEALREFPDGAQTGVYVAGHDADTVFRNFCDAGSLAQRAGRTLTLIQRDGIPPEPLDCLALLSPIADESDNRILAKLVSDSLGEHGRVLVTSDDDYHFIGREDFLRLLEPTELPELPETATVADVPEGPTHLLWERFAA